MGLERSDDNLVGFFNLDLCLSVGLYPFTFWVPFSLLCLCLFPTHLGIFLPQSELMYQPRAPEINISVN